jgi:hypothetical protein
MARPSATAAAPSEKLGQTTAASPASATTTASIASATSSSAEKLTEAETLGECLT